MPTNVQGVVHAAGVGVGTTVTLGDNADPVIGVIGNSYITIDPNQSVDSITLGMIVGGNPGIQDGTKVIGVDRALKVIYLDKALVDNIQLETDADVTFSFSTVTIANHGLSVISSISRRYCKHNYRIWYLHRIQRTKQRSVHHYSCTQST